jgi:hypothetical protein
MSGRPAADPVITPAGFIYERGLISDHIKLTGRCPISSEDLEEYQLNQVQPIPRFVTPRTGTIERSVPTILRLLKIEMENRLDENENLRSQINRVIEEIADLRTRRIAASRVVDRLMADITSATGKVEELSFIVQ